jgi:outer membrane lipoprotein SlyB
MDFMRNNKITILGVIIGGFLGYLYFNYVGCTNGSCIITSRPINSTIYGALMGGLIFNTFQK